MIERVNPCVFNGDIDHVGEVDPDMFGVSVLSVFPPRATVTWVALIPAVTEIDPVMLERFEMFIGAKSRARKTLASNVSSA
jgi:hypothetical protein